MKSSLKAPGGECVRRPGPSCASYAGRQRRRLHRTCGIRQKGAHRM